MVMGPTRYALFLYDGEHIYAEQIRHWNPAGDRAGTYVMSAHYMEEDLTTKYELPQSKAEYQRDGMFLMMEW